ncbi:unnamed protein product [Prorocentrum cordatum]|uniref:VWFD domain-containing protein n=1 Tax=Prorocentrum cordatum TaxID=2364126 RepID=A0ABN9TZF3_9DINO|nr:unnamed protein product [Polarella glacialis]
MRRAWGALRPMGPPRRHRRRYPPWSVGHVAAAAAAAARRRCGAPIRVGVGADVAAGFPLIRGSGQLGPRAEGSVASGARVPQGTGEYIACTTYKYVGCGAGNVALFPVPAVAPGCSCWSHVSFYSQGEYWLVKSQTVWIQARYMPTPITNGLSVEVAVGGPFLDSLTGKRNVLRISALKASFNGQPIIPNFPDKWGNQDPMIGVVTDSNGDVMQPGRQGKEMHVVHVKLPDFVSLQINRWNEPGEGDYINVQITMPKQPGGQDGHCGNFNGNPADDTRPLIRSRVGTTGVAQANLLFETKTPVVKPNRPDLNNCPTKKADHAREVCLRQSNNGMASHDCMVDVCFGGDQFAELGGYDMEEE